MKTTTTTNNNRYEVRVSSYYKADDTWNAQHIESFDNIEEAKQAYEKAVTGLETEKFLIDIETGETLIDSLTYDIYFND